MGLEDLKSCGFPNFSPRVSGVRFKSYGFSDFHMCHGLQVWPVIVLGFPVFHSKIPTLWVFEVMQFMR